jgi:hypothetical protein
MTPILSLAVFVSARTLTCVLVVPSMGGRVGTAVGGRDVWVGCGAVVGGKVAVTNSGRTGGALSVAKSTQPALAAITKTERRMLFRNTLVIVSKIQVV